MNPLTHETTKSNGKIEFLQPYYIVSADALQGISTAVISAVLSIDAHLSQILPKCYQPVYCCLIRYCLPGFAPLNVSRRAVHDFDVK